MQLPDEPKLTIYNSSAGSGKTYTLATEFIRFALLDDQNYRKILAITFTNKATAEMKQRILKFLFALKSNSDDELMTLMENKTGLNSSEIKKRSDLILTNILHNYSFFSVNTIDSFFQRLIKSFAAELNIYINYDLVLDTDEVVSWVVDEMIERSSNDKKLQKWIQNYVVYKMDNDSSIFNIKEVFNSISKDIFNNHLKDKLEQSQNFINDFSQVESLLISLNKVIHSFENQMDVYSQKGLNIYKSNHLTADDFSHKSTGVGSVFEKINKSQKNYDFGSRIITAYENTEKWLSKDRPDLNSLVENELAPLLTEIMEFREKNIEEYLTAIEIVKNIYAFGITNYIEKLKEEYVKENNVLLLSDSVNHISALIKEQEDTPFLYDKIGTYYRYMLLDESQDTSQNQWKNLLPLVKNCLSEGGEVIVVGDVKQSIYRWRGGDVQLLVNGIKEDVYPFLVEQKDLKTNYRSSKTIVEANNEVLEKCLNTLTTNGFSNLNQYYDAYIQEAHQNMQGYVTYQKLQSNGDFEEQSLNLMLQKINNLTEQNFDYKDITILVRWNKESAVVAEYLKANNIPVLSSEALFIQNSQEVKFIISLLKVIDNEKDEISKAFILNYLDVDLLNLKNNFFDALLEEFKMKREQIANSDCYSAVEMIISVFRLQKKSTAYLVELLNIILDFSIKNATSIHSFLIYWDNNLAEGNHSINIPQGENAVNIVSIHKSKGLEFPVVIIPFANWRIIPHNKAVFWFEREKKEDETVYFPINNSKKLAETDFKNQFNNELFLNVLDGLNELYVALTRASTALHVMVEEPKRKPSEISNISTLFLKALDADFNDKGHIEFGKSTQYQHGEEKVENSIKLYEIEVNAAPIEIKLLSQDEDEARAEGKLLHSMLENITKPADIQREIQRILLSGEVPQEEVEKYTKTIQNVLNIESYSRLLSYDYRVLDEIEVYSSLDNRVYRPDKIFIKDDSAIIIDFKLRYSESAESKYRKQLINYKKQLFGMGFKYVQIYILYIEEAEMKEVK